MKTPLNETGNLRTGFFYSRNCDGKGRFFGSRRPGFLSSVLVVLSFFWGFFRLFAIKLYNNIRSFDRFLHFGTIKRPSVPKNGYRKSQVRVISRDSPGGGGPRGGIISTVTMESSPQRRMCNAKWRINSVSSKSITLKFSRKKFVYWQL